MQIDGVQLSHQAFNNLSSGSEEFLPSYLKLRVLSLSRSKSESFIPLNLFVKSSQDDRNNDLQNGDNKQEQ